MQSIFNNYLIDFTSSTFRPTPETCKYDCYQQFDPYAKCYCDFLLVENPGKYCCSTFNDCCQPGHYYCDLYEHCCFGTAPPQKCGKLNIRLKMPKDTNIKWKSFNSEVSCRLIFSKRYKQNRGWYINRLHTISSFFRESTGVTFAFKTRQKLVFSTCIMSLEMVHNCKIFYFTFLAEWQCPGPRSFWGKKQPHFEGKMPTVQLLWRSHN